jgi:hypothetical protein
MPESGRIVRSCFQAFIVERSGKGLRRTVKTTKSVQVATANLATGAVS